MRNLYHPVWVGIQSSELTFALRLEVKSTNIYLVLAAYQVLVGSTKKHHTTLALK